MTATEFRVARIDLDALRRNLHCLGALHPVDLSGDAYGHGFARVATAALDAGSTEFIVRDDDEELALRVIADSRSLHVSSGPSTDLAASGAPYGVGARHPEPPAHTELIPVMTVTARVISVKRLLAGEPVSYGYTWRAPRDTTLALVAIGYADGIDRRASNRSVAFLRGERRIVGRIAMDVLSIDLGDDEVSIGDEVALFGHERGSTDSWASVLGVPALSVTAGIGRRVDRVFIGAGS